MMLVVSTHGTDPLMVVGYDLSEASRAALEYAARRAADHGKLIVVHAFAPEADWPGRPAYVRVADDRAERGHAVLDALLLEEGNVLIDVDYETELVRGSPAEAIVAIAAERDADEIVIGSRGFGRLRGALGSVSHEVLHRADRPVVVIPHEYATGRLGAGSD